MLSFITRSDLVKDMISFNFRSNPDTQMYIYIILNKYSLFFISIKLSMDIVIRYLKERYQCL